jgi:hypothetical protein
MLNPHLPERRINKLIISKLKIEEEKEDQEYPESHTISRTKLNQIQRVIFSNSLREQRPEAEDEILSNEESSVSIC